MFGGSSVLMCASCPLFAAIFVAIALGAVAPVVADVVVVDVLVVVVVVVFPEFLAVWLPVPLLP
jgi:hypothetical protein